MDCLISFLFNQKGQWKGGRGCHKAGKDQICHNNTRNKFSKNRRWLLKGLRPQAIIPATLQRLISTTINTLFYALIFRPISGFVDHQRFQAF